MKVKKTVFVEELGKEVEVEVEFDKYDAMEYLRYYHDSWDDSDILDAINYDSEPDFYDVETFVSNANMSTKQSLIDVMLGRGHDVYFNATLEDEMKEEWWAEVRKKYTLQQLEEVLGNKFNM